jgi:hypothetical protein
MSWFGMGPVVGFCDEGVAFIFEISRIYFI